MENSTNVTPSFFNETPVGPSSQLTVILLSGFFFYVGIFGNGLVILVVVSNWRMRTSVTNMLILTLAVADLILLLFGIYDLVQYVLNRGWLLSLVLCKAVRYLPVISLCASVMTLVAVCVESHDDCGHAGVPPLVEHIGPRTYSLYLVLECDSLSSSKIHTCTSRQTAEKKKKNREKIKFTAIDIVQPGKVRLFNKYLFTIIRKGNSPRATSLLSCLFKNFYSLYAVERRKIHMRIQP